MKRADGKPLSNLEKVVLMGGWLDFIVNENTVGNSIYRVSDGVTFYPTSDGKVFTNKDDAISHEIKYLMGGYKNDA